MAAQNNIADFEAIRWYNEWAYNLRNQIRNHKPINIDGLGVLTMDLSGDIRFKPVDTISTFFQSVPAVRVSRSSVQHVVVRRGDSEVMANHQASQGTLTTSSVSEEKLYPEIKEENIETDQYSGDEMTIEEDIAGVDKWRRNAFIVLTVCILALFFHSFSNNFSTLRSGNQQSIEIAR